MGYWPSVRSRCKGYYMASSVSGQDEPNRALWLATRAGKMEPSCQLGTTRCIPQAIKSFIDQVCPVKMAEYWPRSFFVSVHKHAKKNLANIQPSWLHTWSITHTYACRYTQTHQVQWHISSQKTFLQFLHVDHMDDFMLFWYFHSTKKYSSLLNFSCNI